MTLFARRWNGVAQWLDDIRWKNNMLRIRRYRRKIGFAARQRFDIALRPIVKGGCIAYPDALYYVKIEDILRAMNAANQRKVTEE